MKEIKELELEERKGSLITSVAGSKSAEDKEPSIGEIVYVRYKGELVFVTLEEIRDDSTFVGSVKRFERTPKEKEGLSVGDRLSFHEKNIILTNK